MSANLDLENLLTSMYTSFWNLQGVDNAGENYQKFLSHPTVGVVVNTDDPLQMGRLQVFCPAYGDNPKKILHLPWCTYSSPFAGSIKNSCFTRGAKVGPETSTGAVHYGFWAIPEVGAHVIVGCLDADPKRRFFFGSLSEHQETHTLLHGRYKWGENGGIPDGPLTSEGSPIEPIYTNFGEAFKQDRTSREWKTRGADYQATAVREDIGEVPNDTKSTYLDQQQDKISDAEQDDWVKDFLGAHGYDWTGLKAIGEFMSSRVYGFSSPGFHAFSMDDRAFNSRMRLRSATGHQIILDDTNERIYIMTNRGKSWVEMDSSGNIDVYSDRRISMNAKKGFNFTTDDTFRVHAKKGIHLYSGNNILQDNLESVPNDGEIRIQAENDLHLISSENIRWLSKKDSLFEIGGKKCESIGDSLFLHVQNDIHTITNLGTYYLTISGNIEEIVNGDVNKMALGSMKRMSLGNAQMHSFRGKMDVGAQKNINFKSIGQDITLESVGKNEDRQGAVMVVTPQSRQIVSSEGIFSATNKDIVAKAAKNIHQEIEETLQTDPTPAEDPGPCDLGGGMLPTDGFSGPELAARLAYNAGFRGEDLVIATAMAGAESTYNQNAVNQRDARTEKWGPSYGLWQIRTLQQPQQWGGLDRLRDPNVIGGEQNAQANANLAKQIFDRSNGWREWGSFTDGRYREYMDVAQQTVNNLCGGATPLSSKSPEEEFDGLFATDLNLVRLGVCNSSTINSFINLVNQIANPNSFYTLSNLGINIQSKFDIAVKSITFDITSKFFNDDICAIIPKINELVQAHNSLLQNLSEYFNSLVGTVFGEAGWIIQVAAAVKFMESVIDFIQNPNLPQLAALLGLQNCDINFESLNTPEVLLPDFDAAIRETFQIGSHEACVFTQPELDEGFLTSPITIR
jgi:hypothetical protein